MKGDNKRFTWLQKHFDKILCETSTEDGRPLFSVETGERLGYWRDDCPMISGYSQYYLSLRGAINHGMKFLK